MRRCTAKAILSFFDVLQQPLLRKEEKEARRSNVTFARHLGVKDRLPCLDKPDDPDAIIAFLFCFWWIAWSLVFHIAESCKLHC